MVGKTHAVNHQENPGLLTKGSYMKLFNVFASFSLALLLSASGLYADSSHHKHRDRKSDKCNASHVDAPEAYLKVVRGSVQLDSLCFEADGDLCPGVSSTASVLRGKKFSIAPNSTFAPNFVQRLPDITLSVVPSLPPALLFTRVYEFEFDVIFACEYGEAPTVLLQVESEGDFNFGAAYVSGIATNVSGVTTKGFTATAILYINGFVPDTQTPPYVSPDVNQILLSATTGTTRVNFEAIGRRR